MPSTSGYWTIEEIIYHDWSFRLARWIAGYLNKTKPVIDFGAGTGFYTGYLQDVGFKNVWAIEGNKDTVTETNNIIEQDLTQTFELLIYHNSICLEVGEHIPEEYEQVFINNIAFNTKDKLILSWAVPGQEGYFHVNCKENDWVIDQFEQRNFDFNYKETQHVRSVIEERRSYFRNTLMVFEKC